MTNKEIREQIDINNATIQELMENSTFVLNKHVNDLIDENFALQEQCKHEFVNGICKYCDAMENVENGK